MKLLVVRKDDYCVVKILIVVALVKQTLEVEEVSSEILVALDSSAKGLLLAIDGGGYLSQHLTVLRYVASTFAEGKLVGSSPLARAQVEQWLDFGWNALEVPLNVILSCMGELSPTLTSDEKDKVISKAKSDFITALGTVESFLQSHTYFGDDEVSVSDISLLVVVHMAKLMKLIDLASFISISRWYRSICSIAAVESLISSSPLYSLTLPLASPSFRWDRHRIRVKELLQHATNAIGRKVVVKGWIRTSRVAEKGSIIFVELTDGSSVRGVQLVLSMATTVGAQEVADCGGVGASVSVFGNVVASPAKGQLIEIHVEKVSVLGPVYGGENGEIGGKNYPMAKKQHTLEFLREKAHLRPRSKVFSAAMRIRHAMAFATHKFFNDRGFVYVHTPLVTAADCEGAGEQFVVTTLLPEHVKPGQLPLDKLSNIDFSKDFFGRRCCLTVSGQLNVETHACALSDVYTFGPTFRAENSHTARHLAEFWMIEPEICFADLYDDMALAEDYVKFCTAYALEHCADDLHYFENEYPMGEKGLQARLRNVMENDFAQITYTEAVTLLHREVETGNVQFSVVPQWGDDLGSEHERYITEKIYKKPTIVINYPKGIKAFYMKMNDDNETVAAMDILVPKIGELIGGSQREDNLAVLEQRCKDCGLKPADLWWYMDLRRYGSVPHAGFGLGFERLIMFITGLENIRDVIPFPRVPGHAEF